MALDTPLADHSIELPESRVNFFSQTFQDYPNAVKIPSDLVAILGTALHAVG